MESCYELSTNTYLCYLEQELSSWIMGRVVFDSPVDGLLLQKATDELLRAMPFLSAVKAAAPEGDRYVLVSSGTPLCVRERMPETGPEDPESDGSLIHVSYEGSTLFVDVSHALTDGCGFVTVMRYLVMRYLSYRWDAQPDPSGTFNQLFPYDYADPLDDVPVTASRFEFRYPHTEFFGEEELDPDRMQFLSLDCDERKVTEFARNAEGSFSGVLAGALGSALMNCKPEPGPVVITCPMNMRSVLGCGQTMQNCIQGLRYVFPPVIRKYPFHQRLSLLKGQLYIQRSEEYCLPRFAEWREQLRALRSIPSISGKAEAVRASMRISPYPVVSDLGVIDFGKDNPHVRDLRICSPVSGIAGILIVAHRFGGRCCLDISSTVRSGLWLEQFRQILSEAGIDNELIGNT